MLPTPQANLSTKGGADEPGCAQVTAAISSAGRCDLTVAPPPGAELGPDDRGIDWAQYATAIHRWEHVTRRLAPYPTEPGKRTDRVLAPRLVEWMMGYPAGHVTSLDLSRSAQLRLLGNGVLALQAQAALRVLFSELDTYLSETSAVMSVRITM